MNWYSLDKDQCIHKLNSKESGLTALEAESRIKTYGYNQLDLKDSNSAIKRWLEQFNNFLIYILLLAAIITFHLDHWLDSGVILSVVFLNALIGFMQESKAVKAIEALKKMLSLKAYVIRDGQQSKIDAKFLVPGDIVTLRAGDKVPADIRLLSSKNLQLDEAILTGESMPQEKSAQFVASDDCVLSERKNMLYSGTFVNYGSATGITVETGKNTEIGRISSLLKNNKPFTTPLLKQLETFGRWLAAAILFISSLLFVFGVFIRNYPIDEMFMAAVAMAVSIIPEGLPAIITITLAIGVTRMAKRNAITRRLASVETLSCVSVICTDKTGTLTRNELTVNQIRLKNETLSVTGSGYNDGGLIENAQSSDELELFLNAAVLCNEAQLYKKEATWSLAGNPMDGALLAMSLKGGVNQNNTLSDYPRLDLIPFDSSYKYMASLHHYDNQYNILFIKGAPEILLNYQIDDDNSMWQKSIDELASKGMRVLALAVSKVPSSQTSVEHEDIELGIKILGLVGINDPPRNHVLESIAECKNAGITVKMITGDHLLTAKAIGESIGIDATHCLTGSDIDALNDQQLGEMVDKVNVFARTVPEHKVRLINALEAKNKIVAMTGDGVNDAPALQKADIGIAMGIKGTDVAKEASEMVLADDNFSSIKHAVVEGRNVYNNLKKALLFILPNDGAEGLSIFFAILFGLTLPITPLQILWVNLVTAVTLALALAFETPENDLMLNMPRKPNEPLLSKLLVWRIVFVSLLFVSAMFSLFLYGTHNNMDIQIIRTMVVNVLVILEAVYLINCRHITASVLNKDGILGSMPVLIAIFLVILLQIAFTYLPFMQYFFKTKGLMLSQWGMITIISMAIFFIIEVEKMVLRRVNDESR
jgi:calcium-translocating P-type ATPase